MGGQDITNRLVLYCITKFQETHPNSEIDEIAYGRLQDECENVKVDLSENNNANIMLANFVGTLNLDVNITRKRFEKINEDHFKRAEKIVKDCIRDALDVKKEDINEIILVGGTTRMPAIRKLLANLFDGKEFHKSIHADEAVAYGVALHAASLTKTIKNDYLLLDVTPLTLSVEVKGNVVDRVIHRNNYTIPKNATLRNNKR